MAPHFVYRKSWDLARRRAGLRSLILLGGSYVADLIQYCICDDNLFEANEFVIAVVFLDLLLFCVCCLGFYVVLGGVNVTGF